MLHLLVELTAQDIEVWVQDFGPYDVNTKDVEIIIWANLYLERQVNLDFRRESIGNLVRVMLPLEIKGVCMGSFTASFIWRILMIAAG